MLWSNFTKYIFLQEKFTFLFILLYFSDYGYTAKFCKEEDSRRWNLPSDILYIFQTQQHFSVFMFYQSDLFCLIQCRFYSSLLCTWISMGAASYFGTYMLDMPLLCMLVHLGKLFQETSRFLTLTFWPKVAIAWDVCLGVTTF